MTPERLNELAIIIHEQNRNAGWWDGEPCIYTKLQLISTEIAEATEGARKDLMDDHLPHRKMEEVELADALIRTLDTGAWIGAYFEQVGNGFNTLTASDWQTGHKHLMLNDYLIEINRQPDSCNLSDEFSMLASAIIEVSNQQGYKIFEAIEEKLEYNKQRADHKPENRAKEGGKKF